MTFRLFFDSTHRQQIYNDLYGYIELSIDGIVKNISTSMVLIVIIANQNAVMAAGFQSLASIRLQAEDYLQHYAYPSPYPPEFKVGHLDDRLKLKPCPTPLLIEFTHQNRIQGNTTLNIRCEGDVRWQLLLPARVDLYDDVMVAAAPLQRGQNLDKSLVNIEKRNISRLNNGYYTLNDRVDELEARRNLKRGAILTTANLRPRLLVKTGQHVTILLEYGDLKIKASGQALRSARQGEVVKVRNNQSGRVVEAVVSGEGQVRIYN